MFDAISTPGAGNSADLRPIFEREALPHLDALYAAALRLTRNYDDSRDLTQDTMLRALRFFHRFTPGTNCRAWLLTILHHNFHNRWRRATRERVLVSTGKFDEELVAQSSGTGAFESDPERIMCARSVGGAIGAALETLPQDFRTALIAIDVHGLNYAEAVAVLGLPIGTIKSRVSRGRAMMRHALGRFARSQNVTAKRPKLRFRHAAVSARK